MAMLSQTLKNLKFMKNKKPEQEKVTEKTFSYFACKNIVTTFQQSKEKGESRKVGL